jgi:hypothetical protein
MDVSVFLHKRRKKCEKIKTALTPHREKEFMGGVRKPNREYHVTNVYGQMLWVS